MATKKKMPRPSAVEIIIVVVCVLFLLIAIVYPLARSFNDTQCTITITDKERVNDGGSSRYLIFGESENGEMLVFKNTDSILRWKWNSSDVYGELKVGSTYKVTVVGYRIRFLSEYQNIISYEEV